MVASAGKGRSQGFLQGQASRCAQGRSTNGSSRESVAGVEQQPQEEMAAGTAGNLCTADPKQLLMRAATLAAQAWASQVCPKRRMCLSRPLRPAASSLLQAWGVDDSTKLAGAARVRAAITAGGHG